MTKIIVEREVLHQLAKNAGGGRRESLSTAQSNKIEAVARAIADATAIPENGPFELIVTE